MIHRRLTRLLGLSSSETALLTERARARLGARGYALRLWAFIVATAPGIRQVAPKPLLRRGIRPFVYGLIPGPGENLFYAGAWDGSAGGTADD